jgi:hypothetical protein
MQNIEWKVESDENFRNLILAETGFRRNISPHLRGLRYSSWKNPINRSGWRVSRKLFILNDQHIYGTRHLPNILLYHKIEISTESRKAAEALDNRNRHIFPLMAGLMGSVIHINSLGLKFRLGTSSFQKTFHRGLTFVLI